MGNKPLRIMVEISGNFYEFWEIRTLTKSEQYNDEKENLDYLICINDACDNMMNSIKQQNICYDTVQERDEAYSKLIMDLKSLGVTIVNQS